MKSSFELEIEAPQPRVAELYANPENYKSWMENLKRYTPISGEPGMPGSKFRLVPQTGDMVFVVTVLERHLPNRVRLSLDAHDVAVAISNTFVAVSPEKTKMISEEAFTFKGFINKLFGFLAQQGVRNAHHRQIAGFKRYAENHK